jgi:DNA-binding PadR family transcriptional regulator
MSAQWNRTKALLDADDLIAVSVERFSDSMYFAGVGHLKKAFIRGQSTESTASFTFETGYLIPSHMKQFERLQEHGFTVIIPPSGWRFHYPPQKWHHQVIVEAIDRIAKLPAQVKQTKLVGYDLELAKAVMDSLDDAFPQSVPLIELKYQFSEEPADNVLFDVLSALRGDGYIDGVRDQRGNSKLNPLEQITLTTEGRRHLADEMKRAKSKQPYIADDAAGSILSQLLSEFRERKLGTNELRSGYEGLPPNELKSHCVTAGIDEVDFDLAIDELESQDFIKTGPIAMNDKPPDSRVMVVSLFSKREYSYLTEAGYREAVKIVSAPQPRSGHTIAHMHFSGNTFNNSPIGVGESVSQVINAQAASSNEAFIAFRNEVAKQVQDGSERERILSRLDELEASSELPSRYEKYAMLMGAIGDHITVLGFLVPPILKWITG